MGGKDGRREERNKGWKRGRTDGRTKKEEGGKRVEKFSRVWITKPKEYKMIPKNCEGNGGEGRMRRMEKRDGVKGVDKIEGAREVSENMLKNAEKLRVGRNKWKK